MPSNGELPESSQIDARFFDTKRRGKGGNRPKGDQIDWEMCRGLDKASTEFANKCTHRNPNVRRQNQKSVLEGSSVSLNLSFQFNKGSDWDCKCKNATKNDTPQQERKGHGDHGGPGHGGPGHGHGDKNGGLLIFNL